METNSKATNEVMFRLETPRGTFPIRQVFHTLEEARAKGYGLWFQHDKYFILARDNRVNAVVDLNGENK